jgi:hypothetical protein
VVTKISHKMGGTWKRHHKIRKGRNFKYLGSKMLTNESVYEEITENKQKFLERTNSPNLSFI